MVKKFEPKNFRVSPPKEPVRGFWGGGHTLETDPIQQGWRCYPSKKGPENKIWIVGQRNVEGCASIMRWPNGILDIALYLETPQEIYRRIKTGGPLDARYVQTKIYWGVGLQVIRLILEERVVLDS